jgi:restriction system protein
MGTRKQKTGSRFSQFLQPVLDAIRALGGSARPSEVKEWILTHKQLPQDYLESIHPQSGESKFGNDVDWARFYLVRSAYLDASKRGVWTLTDAGRHRNIDEAEAARIVREIDRPTGATNEQRLPEPELGEPNYREESLRIIKGLPPSGFENLCQRLLRESGFEEVTVTGRSGDGGIDGQGILKLNPFVSFRVLFQCKRYKDSVGPAIVRDFRGAMAGRAEKGIILTTGFFTPQAELEASRDGAQPIELVDGDSLVALLAELELGLHPVKSYEIDAGFFRQFESPESA